MIAAPTPEAIAEAVAALRAGRLVAFPTETVYGLGADASDPVAVAAIFAAKGRPADHPVIVHVSGIAALERWARNVPPAARSLAERFWPGPLTLILPRAAGVSDAVTGGQDTVGLRCPAHPVAQSLLAAFGGGIAAPSANRFGRVSPTQARHVADEFGADALLILDGGACSVGLESSIVDFSRGHPVLLRPGAVSAQDIFDAIGIRPAEPDAAAPRASGTLQAHYQPSVPVRLAPPAQLLALLQEQLAQSRRVAVWSRARPLLAASPHWLWEPAPAEAAAYGQALYARLRGFDDGRCDCILLELPPGGDEWAAVHDRLARAAADPG